MPLKSIALAIPTRTTERDADTTPADLPSGRVRFSDELGRESALAARRAPRTPPPRAANRPRKDASGKAAKDGDPNPAAPAPLGADAPVAPDESVGSLALVGLVAQSAEVDAPDGASEGADPAQGSGIAVASASVAAASARDPEGRFDEPTLVAPPATVDEDAAARARIQDLVGRATGAGTPRILEPAPAAPSQLEDSFALAATPAPGLDVHATADTAALAPRPAVAAPAAPAELATPLADAAPRVALADVPHALSSLLDELGPALRFGRRGRNWEVELRLDPPELGALRFRLELHGDEIRGVVHCEPRVERLLEPVLKDLEASLRQQREGASFDLQREARQQERTSAPWRTQPGAIPDRAPSRAVLEAAADPSRLIDVTA